MNDNIIPIGTPFEVPTLLTPEMIDACEAEFLWLSEPPKKWHTIPEVQPVTARDILGRAYIHGDGDLRVFASIAVRPEDHKAWLHVSYSRAERVPNYDDTMRVKHTFIGDRYAYTIHPPQDVFNQMLRTCQHLWVPLEGNPMPEFARELVEEVQ